MVTVTGLTLADNAWLTTDADNNFSGTVSTTPGTNTFTIIARDISGNATTETYEVEAAGLTKTFTYDANGNLESDGSRVFQWDAVNRVVSIQNGTEDELYSYDS